MGIETLITLPQLSATQVWVVTSPHSHIPLLLPSGKDTGRAVNATLTSTAGV